MQLLTAYLLKVIGCSGLLLVYYRFALRNKRFHYYNRFYLLVTVVASLLLPLLQINWFTVTSNNINTIELLKVITVQGGEANTGIGKGLQFWQLHWRTLALAVYIGVGVLLLAVLLVRIGKIYTLKKQYGTTNMAEFDFINTNLPQAPFSYLRNLFWRSDIDINSATGQQILRHELTHIRQKHTWDKLWMHLATSVCWVNPFFWFIQKELHMLHEFIADEKAIENNDGAAFATMLLTAQFGKNMFSPAQPFSYSPIKRRLFMLTNLTKPRYSYLRRLMLLPLLAFVLTMFGLKLQKAVANPTKTKVSIQHYKEDTTKPVPLYVLDGKVVGKADIDKLDAANIESVHVLKGKEATEKYGDKGINGVVECYTKANAVTQTDKAADAPLYVINGKMATKNVLDSVDASNIESVSVLKDGEAKQKYGDKAVNGVVEIITKKAGEKYTAKAQIKVTNPTHNGNVSGYLLQLDKNNVSSLKAQPLYVLDGKIIDPVEFKAIDPNTIESINVLKGKTATDLYGDKGVNGVIEISLKKAGSTSTPPKRLTFDRSTPKVRLSGSATFVQPNGDSINTKVDSLFFDEAQFKSSLKKMKNSLILQ